MTLMAVHLVSHINSSQRGLGLVGRCRRAAKSFVVLWLSSAWLKRNGMQIKATRVCQILCLRSLFCLFLYINKQLPSPYNISQKCWNALSHSFKTDFLPFLPVPKVLIWYCSNFMPCDLLDFFFWCVCVHILYGVCAHFFILSCTYITGWAELCFHVSLGPAAKAFLCPFSFLFQIQVYSKIMQLHYRSTLHHTTIQHQVFLLGSLLSDRNLKTSYTSKQIPMSPFQYHGIP